MSNKPQLSVIIPTYNYAHYITIAIDSVLNCNFNQDEIEIVIVDDGSTDDTQKVLNKYIADPRIRYIYQNNQGKASATQVAIDNALGEYIFNLDADDYFLPNKLQQVVNISNANPHVVHVSHPALCWVVEKDTKSPEPLPQEILNKKNNGKDLLSFFYKRRILFGGGSTFAARASALRSFRIPQAVDMFIDEYLLLFTLNQGDSFFLAEPLSIWRIHDQNFSDNPQNNIAKKTRKLNSKKAIVTEVLKGDFNQDLQLLFKLKEQIDKITYDEIQNQKSLADVTKLWSLILLELPYSYADKLQIIKNYTIINRTLPSGILNFLRQLKN